MYLSQFDILTVGQPSLSHFSWMLLFHPLGSLGVVLCNCAISDVVKCWSFVSIVSNFTSLIFRQTRASHQCIWCGSVYGNRPDLPFYLCFNSFEPCGCGSYLLFAACASSKFTHRVFNIYLHFLADHDRFLSDPGPIIV